MQIRRERVEDLRERGHGEIKNRCVLGEGS